MMAYTNVQQTSAQVGMTQFGRIFLSSCTWRRLHPQLARTGINATSRCHPIGSRSQRFGCLDPGVLAKINWIC
jgi:hypothetical protein